MKEIWKQLPGFSTYDVSNLGRIRSWRGRVKSWNGFPRHMPHIRTPAVSNNSKSMQIALVADDGSYVTCVFAPLIKLTFDGLRPHGLEVAHENGNFRDNRLVNLVFKTPLENDADKDKHGTRLRGEHHPRSKLNLAQVIEIKRSQLRTFELARKFGVPGNIITSVRSGRSWKHVE